MTGVDVEVVPVRGDKEDISAKLEVVFITARAGARQRHLLCTPRHSTNNTQPSLEIKVILVPV